MKTRVKEQGSAVELVVIIVLVVAVLGLLGFVLWQNFMNKSDTDTTGKQTTSEQKDSATHEGTLSLAEWGLNATYDAHVLGTVSYVISGDTLTLSSSKVEKDILPCDGVSASSWGIEKSDTAGSEASLKVGDAYYTRTYPQAGCEDKADQVSAVDQAYERLFKSLAQH